jgi:uncharacterized protein (DUF58 family)
MYQMNVDVLELAKKVNIALSILVENKIISRYRSVFRGKGLEFDGYRLYTSNDDSQLIDWKATVRSNQTLVKQFHEERNLNVNFLIDVSSSMVFGSGDKLKCEYAAELIASLSNFILIAGDNVGLFLFNDNITTTLPCKGGKNQFYMILKTLVDSKQYGGGYDLPGALHHILSTGKKKSLLFIVSDFIGLNAGWEETVKLASGKFDVIGVMIRDPRDRQLPRNVGQVVISDPYSGRTMLIDPDEVGDDYEMYVKQEEENIERGFKNNNADFVMFPTDQPIVKPLVNFLKRREVLLSQ